MYVKIEPSGTIEKDGMVQVRYSFYLDKEDEGYDKCVVIVVNEKDEEITQVNPFHNHFCYFEPTITIEEVMAIGSDLCKDAYVQWWGGETPEIINPRVEFPTQVVSARKAECDQKVIDLTTTEIKRTILTKDAR